MVDHYVNGRRVYTIAEASDILHTPGKTISSRLARAHVEPADWIIPGKLAVYYASDLGIESALPTAAV
jgi:hypothetical protein